jgi:magnesium-transporting ATPase (P-type)
VLYTGTDTKLILNLGNYVTKTSTIEKKINMVLTFNIIFMLLLSGASCIVAFLFSRKNFGPMPYLGFTEDEVALQTFASFWRIYLLI